jgi:hypothetical protein
MLLMLISGQTFTGCRGDVTGAAFLFFFLEGRLSGESSEKKEKEEEVERAVACRAFSKLVSLTLGSLGS